MTKQQITDLANWKKNPDQELPASLENALIERIKEELKSITTPTYFDLSNSDTSIISIMTILSLGEDGQAVMEFLDVESKEYKELFEIGFYYDKNFRTLGHLLYREFTEALRTGKTLNEALKIINLIYLQNAYA